MVRKILIVSTLAASVFGVGCSSTQMVTNENQRVIYSSDCLDCEPSGQKVQLDTVYVPRCPNSVEVIQYLPGCVACSYPVTIRSSAETCQPADAH
ncbi:hypothetical protein JX580_08060 [Thiomicrospira microaerophila]|uniref:hypothetical protein n=1 Tax=Thiomicrospira microaerophila TaxID=406020 RepID=UPI00200F4D5B|nr:hypothetical protein [Thiomicrospira microaerophila]UQB41626.1 hypothetical protein JX580_08060 [Thiomicrospira microaerophila]